MNPCLPESKLMPPQGCCKTTAWAIIPGITSVSFIKEPQTELVNKFDYHNTAAIAKTVSS